MYNRFYKPKLDKAKQIVDKMFKLGAKVEDDEGIIEMITPFKMSITPKEMTVEELQHKFIMKLNKRHLLKYIACYIEGDKVILEKLMI